MWNSLQTPKSEDIEDLLEQAPTSDTPDSGTLPRMLERQQSEESEDDDADYIPAGLASFVKQIDATLNSTKQGFLTTAAKSPVREPTIFCFDGGNGRAATPPMEDEDDMGLRNEVMEKFIVKSGDQRYDVQQILEVYGDNTPNETDEILFSPDLKTPPPNPHYRLTATEARQMALGSPGLTVDTDILPIRPPAHDDHSGSSSQMEEPDEPMDPMSWLDSALCDRPTNNSAAEKRPDISPRSTRERAQDPTAALFHGVSYDLTSPTNVQQNAFPRPKASPQPIPTVHEIDHVGEVDETKLDPPPSSPKHTTTQVANVKVQKPPLEIEVRKDEEKRIKSVPTEIEVQAEKKTEPEQIVPMEVEVERKTPKFDKAKQKEPPVSKIEIQSRIRNDSQKTPTQTQANDGPPPSSNRTTALKQSDQSVFDRLSRPTSASKATSLKQPAQCSTQPPNAATPPARSIPTAPSSAVRTSASKRAIEKAQRPKISARTSSSETTHGTNHTSPTFPSGKAVRTSGKASPSMLVQSSASKARVTTGVKRNAETASTRTTPPVARVTRTFKQTQTKSIAGEVEHGTSPVLTTHRNSTPIGVSSRLLQETTASKQRHAEAEPEHKTHHVASQHEQAPLVSSRLLQETTSSNQRHMAKEELRHDSPSPRSSSRDAPGPHISSRLLQDTVSSRLHHSAAEEALHANDTQVCSPSRDLPAPHLSSRLLQETTASRLRHAATEEELHLQSTAHTTHMGGVKADVPSRLLQETTAFKQRLAASAEHLHSTPPKTIICDESKLLASREKAQARIRLHIAKEKERERALEPSGRSTKLSAEEGISRAKERLRQRQLKEQQKLTAIGKENNGRKAPPKRPARPSFVGVQGKQRRPLTIPNPPKLSTSRRHSVRHTPTGSRGGSVDSEARGGHPPVIEMTLAQSTDILRKGLRHEEMSHCSNVSRHRELTIAQAPRFATSARYGEKLSSASWKEAPTLASSTRLLQNQLRGEDPSVMKKRDFKLTVPEAPKFQKSAKRVLPKSTAELEDEMMKKINSNPFKALPYRPHAPRTVTTAHKSTPRPTISKPFHLATYSRAAAAAASSPKEIGPKVNPDDVELKKKFHARPMPSFTNPPHIKKVVGPNSNLDRSISPPKLRTSDRAGKRLETAQTFSSHAEQIRRQKELELKRRQKEKHEEEMRKAESSRSITAASAPAVPFQLASLSRHENYLKKREEKLRQEEDEKKKAASFHARQFRPAPVPEQKAERSLPTTPEPFHLKSEERHSAYEEKNRKKIMEAEEQVHQQAQFRARPVPQTTYKSTSPSSAQQVLLATTARLRAYQEQKQKREEAELEEIRKQSQFKARPVPPSTYEYAFGSSPRRSPNASPGRHGFQDDVNSSVPGSPPGRIEMNGAANQPIVVDEPLRATPPTRPPVSSIVFQA